MQDAGSYTWNTSSVAQEEPNDSYRRSHEVKDEDATHTMDPNSSMWRAITSDHKEIEEKPKDQTLSIQNYYRDRWIQEHKEKRSDNITKQAVKIFSDEPAPQQNSGQSPHEASIYRKLANRHIPTKEMKSFDPEKDGSPESIESIKISRRISADQFNDDDFKNMPQSDRFSGGLNTASAFRPSEMSMTSTQNQPYTAPRFQLAECSPQQMSNQKDHHTYGHVEKEVPMSAPGPYNVGPPNSHSKYVQKNVENWSTIIDGNSPGKVWNKSEAKQEPSNKGNAIIQTQDPIVTFKPDM